MKKISLFLLIIIGQINAYALNDPLSGYKINSLTTRAVPVHNECAIVTNNDAVKSFFIPTKTLAGWTNFKNNHPASIVFKNCTTCKDIFDSGGSYGDGVYFIDPDGSGPNTPFASYCDMTTDGGGWTLVLKSTGADRTNSFDPFSMTSSWVLPISEGDPSNLTSVTTFSDRNYDSHPVQDIMIRSLSNNSKRVVWTHGSNSPSLKFMIDKRTPMFGKRLSGGVEQLDYRSGCDIGVIPSSQYLGIFPRDVETTNTVNLFSGAYTNTPSWFAALIGWGSLGTDYNSGKNTSGGFGSRNMFGHSWNFNRHVHGIGNGCNTSEWGTSSNVGSQSFNPHGLFVRVGSTHRTCKEIIDATPGLPSGVYTVDIDGDGGNPPFQVYCDMTTDGGGWTMVAYAGTITTNKQSTTGTSYFSPLFNIYGTVQTNSKTSKVTFSRMDLFSGAATNTSQFMTRRTSVPSKILIWPLHNKTWWGSNAIAPGSRQFLDNVPISYLRISTNGSTFTNYTTNVFWTVGGAGSGSYPGISMNVPTYENCDNCGRVLPNLNRRSILYFEDLESTYSSQWFHGQSLSFTDSTGPLNNIQDFEFYFR